MAPHQSSPPPASGARRRSSTAMYDPARDIIRELPAVDEISTEPASVGVDDDHLSQSEAGRSSSPTIPTKASQQSKRNSRPPSPITQDHRQNPVTLNPMPEPKMHSSVPEHTPDPHPSSHSERLSETKTPNPEKENGKAKTLSELPRIKRKIREDGEIPSSKRPKSPSSAYSRRPDIGRQRSPARQLNGDRPPPPRRSRSRSPQRRRSPPSAYRRLDPSPPRRERSPSPIRASPPREGVARMRPGGATGRGRNVLAEAQRLQEQREREQAARTAQVQQQRGVQDVSNQFYNARPNWVKERGRDWRRNESKIKGLRNFNNWIKSCIIQKYSPEEMPQKEDLGWGEQPKEQTASKPLLILDIGCGKGGDLGKWQLASQPVGLYVGLDPASQSISQALERYKGMRRGRRPLFEGRFHVQDCFGEWIGNVPIVRDVGIDPNAGSGPGGRWGGGGFDVVTMMFSMHYAFETEERVRTMLRNVAGSLKKGGRFIGVVPNSDAIAASVIEWHKKHPSGENKDPSPAAPAASDPKENGHGPSQASSASQDGNASSNAPVADDSAPNWGNSIYSVRFPSTGERPTAADGTFRPPFGWKYMYWMDEAVDVPEYVVPWEAFRAVAEGFNLEQRYRKPFLDIWASEKDDKDLGPLSVRMGVTRYEGGPLEISPEEREAVSFYHAFCFVKV